MSGYTPGPWVYDDDTATVDTKLGVAVAGINDEFGWERTVANGQLIAAAPFLLATLESIRFMSAGNDCVATVLMIKNAAERAVAVAEGHEPSTSQDKYGGRLGG